MRQFTLSFLIFLWAPLGFAQVQSVGDVTFADVLQKPAGRSTAMLDRSWVSPNNRRSSSGGTSSPEVILCAVRWYLRYSLSVS